MRYRIVVEHQGIRYASKVMEGSTEEVAESLKKALGGTEAIYLSIERPSGAQVIFMSQVARHCIVEIENVDGEE